MTPEIKHGDLFEWPAKNLSETGETANAYNQSHGYGCLSQIRVAPAKLAQVVPGITGSPGLSELRRASDRERS